MVEFVSSTVALACVFNQYSVEFIGEDAFIHTVHSDNKPLVVHGVPGPVATAVAARAGGRSITLSFTAKRLMDVGEPTEHWCARYLRCGLA
jgi:hypothetical protein